MKIKVELHHLKIITYAILKLVDKKKKKENIEVFLMV